MAHVEVKFGIEIAFLLPEKGVWLPESNSLIIADVHWGKIDHFRKAGIAVPVKGNDKNTELLISLIHRWKPQRVIFLGDLFHSVYNDDWETFGRVRQAFSHCSFELVVGNHDILSKWQYERHNILVHAHHLALKSLWLTHEPLEEMEQGRFNLAGHIHPGAHLVGTGKQSVTLPCFYIKERQCILPAFGAFTGLAKVRPKKNERIFVLANGKVMPVNES